MNYDALNSPEFDIDPTCNIVIHIYEYNADPTVLVNEADATNIAKIYCLLEYVQPNIKFDTPLPGEPDWFSVLRNLRVDDENETFEYTLTTGATVKVRSCTHQTFTDINTDQQWEGFSKIRHASNMLYLKYKDHFENYIRQPRELYTDDKSDEPKGWLAYVLSR